ncbi:MAG: hypothetical protein KKD44_16915 [Proteobacteria bacterium]|nr:hypothetical protein [Pseudomonadota bacterium]
MLIAVFFRTIPIEIKSGQTVTNDYFSGLRKWIGWAAPEAKTPYVIYGGDDGQKRKECQVVPWREVTGIADSL